MNEEVQKVLEELKGGITKDVFEKLMTELPNRKDIFEMGSLPINSSFIV